MKDRKVSEFVNALKVDIGPLH